MVAFYSTGGGVKGGKNLYLLTLLFIYKLAFILFVMTPGAQTTGNIAVYGSETGDPISTRPVSCLFEQM